MTESHEEAHECSHSTAIDEAIHRLELSIHAMHHELKEIRWWKFRTKLYMLGMMQAFIIIHTLLVGLNQKYNNTNGSLN